MWGSSGADIRYLRVYVGQVREKIETAPATPVILVAEPGFGYRLANVDQEKMVRLGDSRRHKIHRSVNMLENPSGSRFPNIPNRLKLFGCLSHISSGLMQKRHVDNAHAVSIGHILRLEGSAAS